MKKARVVLLFTALIFSSLLITACGNKRDKKSSEVELSVGSRSNVSSRDSTMDEDYDYLDDEDSGIESKGKNKSKSFKDDSGFTKKSESKNNKPVGQNKSLAKSQPKTSEASVGVGGKKASAQKKQSTADMNANFEEYKKWIESRKNAGGSSIGKGSSSSEVGSSPQAGSPQSSIVSQSSVVSQSSQSPEKTQSSEVKKETLPSSVASSSPVVA